MRILITGAAGFIGSNLTNQLLSEGHEVVGIDNFSYGLESNIASLREHANFTFVEGDLNDASILDGHDAQVLVHLASQKIPRYTSALRTLTENSALTKNVVAKCLEHNMKLVFASTSDVYGKNPELPYHEESNLLLGPTTVKRWAYATSKIHSELYIQANGEENDLRYTICRFFGSYGPNQNLTWWGGPQSVFIKHALNDESIDIHGTGEQTRTFTYIDDTVQGICKCVLDDRSTGGIYNIASEPTEEISIMELGKLIWKMVNGEDSEPKINMIPYSTFGKYEDVMRRVPSIEKIKSQLEYAPKHNLREGLEKTIEWQRNMAE